MLILHDIPYNSKFKDPCFYCQRDLRRIIKTNDHVIPISKGGKDAKNVVRCCSQCNQFKANKDLETWLNEVRMLVKSKTEHKWFNLGQLGCIISGIKQAKKWKT